MAEMTAAEAVRIINSAKSYLGQPDDYCSINLTVEQKDQIAALIQQQAQQIEQLKCCGNCINWLNRPEKMSCKIHEMDVAQWCRCGEWQVKEGLNDV